MDRCATRILGVGNPLMGDDGVGIAAVERLSALRLPEGVEVVDGGTGGITLLALMEGAAEVVVIDAAEMGLPPGEFRRFSGDALMANWEPGMSVHQAGLGEVLALGRELDLLPEVTLFAVQPESVVLRQALSAPVAEGLERLLEVVVGAWGNLLR